MALKHNSLSVSLLGMTHDNLFSMKSQQDEKFQKETFKAKQTNEQHSIKCFFLMFLDTSTCRQTQYIPSHQENIF